MSYFLLGCDRTESPSDPIDNSDTTQERTATSPAEPIYNRNVMQERVTTSPFPTSDLPNTPAPDFAIIFGYSSCPRIARIINTFNNTFTQISTDTEPITISISLSSKEKAMIYERMRTISFYQYPEEYDTMLPPEMPRLYEAPHPIYEFTIRNNGQTKHVIWQAQTTLPKTTETDNLKMFADTIKSIIESRPEIQTLPALNESCA
jgi:hypothetical protein